jgi:epoxyqueuosine reductase
LFTIIAKFELIKVYALIYPLASIQQLANSIGFSACGVSTIVPLYENEPHLKSWLNQGMHGEMGYMERNFEKRIDPSLLVPNAKSVISVLLNYFPGNPDISVNKPKISRYALSIDYHSVMKKMLWELADKIRKEIGEVNGRAFVDSAPVLEREWALRAGLGWIGKNSLLLNPKLGTYTFIGELIVDIEIEPTTTQLPNRCGTCTRCIDACPTGAIVSPSVVDARKCISYLTIEKKSELTANEKENLNGWCFGCDICQEVCPWNSKINQTLVPQIAPTTATKSLTLDRLKNLNEEEFNEIFGQTPVSRTGYSKLVTNIKSAL